jgi:hypothetical protein
MVHVTNLTPGSEQPLQSKHQVMTAGVCSMYVTNPPCGTWEEWEIDAAQSDDLRAPWTRRDVTVGGCTRSGMQLTHSLKPPGSNP